jgi:hypothetical protein
VLAYEKHTSGYQFIVYADGDSGVPLRKAPVHVRVAAVGLLAHLWVARQQAQNAMVDRVCDASADVRSFVREHTPNELEPQS